MVQNRNLWHETDDQGLLCPLSDGPVNLFFGLSYANYLTWPRVLMEHMPLEWQQRFSELAEEFSEEWDAEMEYEVRKRDSNGRYTRDPLAEYRRPNHHFIESLQRSTAGPLNGARIAGCGHCGPDDEIRCACQIQSEAD